MAGAGALGVVGLWRWSPAARADTVLGLGDARRATYAALVDAVGLASVVGLSLSAYVDVFTVRYDGFDADTQRLVGRDLDILESGPGEVGFSRLDPVAQARFLERNSLELHPAVLADLGDEAPVRVAVTAALGLAGLPLVPEPSFYMAIPGPGPVLDPEQLDQGPPADLGSAADDVPDEVVVDGGVP